MLHTIIIYNELHLLFQVHEFACFAHFLSGAAIIASCIVQCYLIL